MSTRLILRKLTVPLFMISVECE